MEHRHDQIACVQKDFAKDVCSSAAVKNLETHMRKTVRNRMSMIQE